MHPIQNFLISGRGNAKSFIQHLEFGVFHQRKCLKLFVLFVLVIIISLIRVILMLPLHSYRH
jgi:hypothetical protein